MNLTEPSYSVICNSPLDREQDKFLYVVGQDPTKKFIKDRWIISRASLEHILNILDKKYIDFMPVFNIGAEMKLPLYPYQSDVAEFGVTNGSSLLVLPCGAGKTPLIIDLFLDNRRAGKIDADAKGMVVVKSSLKIQWKMEVAKFSNLKATVIDTYKAVTASVSSKIKKLEKRREALVLDLRSNRKELAAIQEELAQLEKQADGMFDAQFEGAELFILNYETLKDVKVKRKLRKCNIQFAAADECHLIKDPKAARSKALCEFADVRVRYGATATPLKKNPMDILGLSKFIRPSAFASDATFKSRYVNFNRFGAVSGTKNEKELHEKLSDWMIVKTKEEISDQLPEVVNITRSCQLTPAQLAMHEQLMEEIKELKEKEGKIIASYNGKPPFGEPELQKVQAGILARQTFALELADCEELLTMSDSDMAKRYVTKSKSDKLEVCMDMIDELTDSGEKVVIFSRFQRMQTILGREIEKRFPGTKVAYVNGSMTSEERYEEVYTKFKEDPDCKVLIMSDAGAEGISIGWCKYLIQYDVADSYLIHTQRIGRIERADSLHSTVYAYQLIAENSYDEICLKIIEKKEKYHETIIRGAE